MNSATQELIATLKNIKGIRKDIDRNTLTFNKNQNTELLPYLQVLGVETELAGVGVLEIDIKDLPFHVFYNEAEFLQKVNRNSWSKPLLLLEENIFFSVQEEKTYQYYQEATNYFLVSNNFYCYQFLSFLHTQEHRDSSAFYFVDYFNWDSRHVVLTSLKKDGKVEFVLPNEGLSICEDVNLKKAVSEFKAAFLENNKHFPKFIKTELISTVSKIEKSKRLEKLIRSLSEIMYVSSQNFEIYLHDLSIESLKKDFIEHKNKYFIQLREVLSKLTNQVIGLPLTIAASVFSTYKVSDSISTLFIILAVFIIYIMYSVYLLKVQKEDITDIKVNFQLDFNKLKESTFFKKFPSELKEFERIKSSLNSRINSLISALDLYFLLFSTSSVLFIIYVQGQMKTPSWSIVLVATIMSLGLLVIYILTQTLRQDHDL